MFREEYVQALVDLGLTSKQARIYLNLAKLGRANAQTIAVASKIARQDVYTAMPVLERMGLVEKMITQPTTFRATQLKTGLSILLNNRTRENTRIHKNANLLLKDFNSVYVQTLEQTDDSAQFSIINEVTLLQSTHQKLLETAEDRIDVIIPFVSQEIVESFQCALSRGIKIRFLTKKPRTNNTFLLEQTLENYQGVFEAKNRADIEWGMHIIDSKQVTFALERKQPVPSLWSNNPRLVQIMQNYFNENWQHSKRYTNSNKLKPTVT
jgi:sugar-specific transcriptional regulator TrmB